MAKPDQTQLNLTVTSDTNPGSAGGTRNYINLGGIKICWGSTANNIGSVTPITYNITFPTSFFSATPVFNATVGPNNSTNAQTLNIAGTSLSNSGVGVNILTTGATTSAEPVQWIAIGT